MSTPLATASTYQGKYTAFVNNMRNNMQPWMKKRAPLGLMTLYDSEFRPVLQDIFPKIAGPRVGGSVVSINTPFQIPYTASLGQIAPMVDKHDQLDEQVNAFGREVFQARMTKFAGPTIDPLLFKNEFEEGFLEATNQIQIVEAMTAISRRIELELCNISFGTAASINQFSNQSTERLKVLDASVATGVKGTVWSDTANADPMYDMTFMNMEMGDLKGTEIKNAFIGNKTAWHLDNNAKIMGYAQYHFDVTQTIVGKSIKGITFKKVIGQDYKDNAALNSGKLNYPGQGDHRPDTWSDRNKVPMMRHTVSSTTYEWALFTDGQVGNTYTARTNENQTDTNVPYPHSWKDDRLGYIYSTIQLGFCPAVKDFASMIVLKKVCAV